MLCSTQGSFNLTSIDLMMSGEPLPSQLMWVCTRTPSSRTRYFERATLIVKRLYMKCVVAPWLVPTKFMVADIFTKMLDRDAFFLCRSYLMNLDNAPSQMVPGRFTAMTRQWTRLLWSP